MQVPDLAGFLRETADELELIARALEDAGLKSCSDRAFARVILLRELATSLDS
jgi:hypothetical protein